ncbi:hypothetical protein NQ314_014079 [Rhamnusium bicolor]|uniref:RETREG1-3/ARL6IP-like N-terminal reticulon-homology domain-containing protein n=1 Tax=Rhamnusium bicolor TaxID=1586634 RepID=A0AAV8X3Q4_9CUCU|nr:hypothetical protein NQ314_014079 [Rhamnusium bicolor]
MSENEIDMTAPGSFESTTIGDATFPKFIKTFEDNMNIPPFPSEYKISYPPTMESQIRKLRLSMETWREVIIKVNDILLWEKQWHPMAIIGGCTVLFMLLWLCEPNLLTVISLLGLSLTVGDYILPTLISSVFKSEVWTTEKQKQYEEICTNIILYKMKLELLLSSYYRMRVTNSKLYFSITIFGLAFLAWIGGTISNLLLTYLIFLFALLLPGMSHNGMLNKGSEALSKIFSDLVENAKSKVGQKKIQ